MTHEQVQQRLGARIDGELDESEARLVDAHVGDCVACERALRLQRSVRDRLASEPAPVVDLGFLSEVRATIERDALRASPRAPSPIGKRSSRRVVAAWSGWAVAAGLAAVLTSEHVAWRAHMPASAEQVTDLPPMVDAVLADFQRATGEAFPPFDGDWSALQRYAGFPVVPMQGPDLQVISAWQTVVRDERSVGIAYRYGDRTIIQYFVPSSLFFRRPEVRDAVQRSGAFEATRDGRAVIAWPTRDAGALLVGAASLASLRHARESG